MSFSPLQSSNLLSRSGCSVGHRNEFPNPYKSIRPASPSPPLFNLLKPEICFHEPGLLQVGNQPHRPEISSFKLRSVLSHPKLLSRPRPEIRPLEPEISPLRHDQAFSGPFLPFLGSDPEGFHTWGNFSFSFFCKPPPWPRDLKPSLEAHIPA